VGRRLFDGTTRLSARWRSDAGSRYSVPSVG